MRVTTSPYMFLTYASRNAARNVIEPLAPYNVLVDPMVSSLSPTVIAYIPDTADRYDSKKEKKMRSPQSPNLI